MCLFLFLCGSVLVSLQQIANSILLATAAIVGLLCYFLGEAKQRRAFLEAKKSLEVKMVIEEQSAEQVCPFPNCKLQFLHCILLLRVD